jgi:methionyl-tRNA formyltransferase
MRVAILTSVPEVAIGYHAIVRGLGHEVVCTLVPSIFRANFDETTGLTWVESKDELAVLLREHAPDVGLCTGFPWLIPQETIDIPRLGIVNGHPTLLPRGRGPYPWAWAVRNGDTELGLTYHFMDASFDTGNVLAQKAIPFDPEHETQETLLPKMQAASAELIPQVFAKLEAGDGGTPQGEGDYQHRFEPEYGTIDTSLTAAEVARQVRAWSWMPPRFQTGPLLDGRRAVAASLSEVAGAERVECADGPVWLSF